MRDEFESTVAGLATKKELADGLESKVERKTFQATLDELWDRISADTQEYTKLQVLVEDLRDECHAVSDTYLSLDERLQEIRQYLVRRFKLDAKCLDQVQGLAAKYRALGMLQER